MKQTLTLPKARIQDTVIGGQKVRSHVLQTPSVQRDGDPTLPALKPAKAYIGGDPLPSDVLAKAAAPIKRRGRDETFVEIAKSAHKVPHGAPQLSLRDQAVQTEKRLAVLRANGLA